MLDENELLEVEGVTAEYGVLDELDPTELELKDSLLEIVEKVEDSELDTEEEMKTLDEVVSALEEGLLDGVTALTGVELDEELGTVMMLLVVDTVEELGIVTMLLDVVEGVAELLAGVVVVTVNVVDEPHLLVVQTVDTK